MEAAQWPFRPHHITNDGEKHEGKTILHGVGIISNEYLQGIQTYISSNLKSPTTIIEFSPEGIPVRTDSKFLNFSLRPSCAAFRKCTDTRYCQKCDEEHAKLFRGLNRHNMTSEITKRIEESRYIKENYPEPFEKPAFREHAGRGYLRYDCPLLGYRELVFPVFFEDKVIAVFFTGEIIRDDKLDFIKHRMEHFFASHPDWFEKHRAENQNCINCEDGKSCSSNSLRACILSNYDKLTEYPMGIHNKEEYNSLISSACAELEGLEQTIRDQMELQRERYIRERIDERIQDFRAQLPKGPSSSTKDLVRLWGNMEHRMEDVVLDFDFKYVIVFGIKEIFKEKVEVLDVVVKVGKDMPDFIRQNINSLKFDLSEISPDYLTRPTNSDEAPQLFDGLQGLDRRLLKDKLSRILLFPVPFHPDSSVAILIGYKDDNDSESEENRTNGYLYTSLQSFDTVVFSALSSMLASIAQSRAEKAQKHAEKAQKQMEEAIRIFGHETAQLTSALNNMQFLYLSDVKRLRSLSDNKAFDLCHDIEGCIKLINLLFKKADMMLSLPEVKKTRFFAFKELLYKWKSIYRLDANEKKLLFDVPEPDINDMLRPAIYADKTLLEQLVYNLVSNAVKYSYWGTKISIDCKKPDTLPHSPHILTVTNYGHEIEQGDKPYELYYRGENVQGEHGVGIGLYLAKRIAQAHGGEIFHLCEKVSDFNIPLMEAYLYKIFNPVINLSDELKKEVSKLKSRGIYYDVISMDRSDGGMSLSYNELAEEEISEMVYKPTYKVTFTVTIPSKEEER